MAAAAACLVALVVADPAVPKGPDPNWITVSPTKRYLVFEDGTPFLPLGVAMDGDHINFDYFGRTTIEGRRISFADDHFETLFADMRAHGENFLRIDIESTSLMPRPDIERLIRERKIQFVEDPVGVFNEDYARRIDRLIATAEKYDVYLGLVLIAQTCDLTTIGENLDLYPYHRRQGGPIDDLNDLFTSPEARRAWRNRLRYISERWGGSRRIAMWELYNELLNCGGRDVEAAERWVAEMGSALREFDRKRYGKAHPVIVSTVSIVPEHRFFFDSPGTDLMVSHFYTDVNDSGNPVRIALEVQSAVHEDLATLRYSRPFLENERTLSRRYPVGVQKEVEHAAAWSMIASGAAGGGATWVRMGEYATFRTKEVVSDTHRAMRAVLSKVDFARFDSRPLEAPAGNREVVPMVLSDGSTVLGWLLHNNPNDYDIDNIRAWQQGRFDDRVAGIQLLGRWIEIAGEAGYSSRLKPILDRVALAVSKATGLSQDEAARRIKEAFQRPGRAKRALARIARDKDPELVRQKAQQALRAVETELARLEQEKGVLKKLYRGHPVVSTSLTLSGLRNGRHRVTWYDDATGAKIREEVVTGSRVVLQSPPFRKHVAFVIAP